MTTSGTSIYSYSCSETQEKQTKCQKYRLPQIAFLKFLRVWGDRTFFRFSAALAHEYTDLAKFISRNGKSTDFAELVGAAWHREGFQSEKEIMTKCQRNENQGFTKVPLTCFICA